MHSLGTSVGTDKDMSRDDRSPRYYVRRRVLNDALMLDQARELKGTQAEIYPTVRNGRFWAGGYSSDSIEGLRKILAQLKRTSP